MNQNYQIRKINGNTINQIHNNIKMDLEYILNSKPMSHIFNFNIRKQIILLLCVLIT